MSMQNESPFVKLIKKSLGLPTGDSNCCGAPAEQPKECCGAESSGCGCENEGCGAEEEKESKSSPAVGSSAI